MVVKISVGGEKVRANGEEMEELHKFKYSSVVIRANGDMGEKLVLEGGKPMGDGGKRTSNKKGVT